ncbi:pathogenesis-related BetVI family protein, partial [Acinetobacter baumannii]
LEFKTEISPSRLFKGLVLEANAIAPKAAPQFIKSVEVVEGSGVGSVVQTTFTDEAPVKLVKHRFDSIDAANYTCKFTLIEGDVIGEKIEKISYDGKIEESGDGGSILKQTVEYHTKGDAEVTDEEYKRGNDQATLLFKATEAYLIANPQACA